MIIERPRADAASKKEKIILTGGTEGIGRAIASELCHNNHEVVICARTQEKLEEMKYSNTLEAYQLDLNDTDKIDDFIKQGTARMNGLSLLILNAAVSGIRESKDYTYSVDCAAQKKLVESSADLLRDSKGRIVFITSPQASQYIEGHEQYGHAKKEIEDWLQEFSEQDQNKNIHVFSVNPGQVDTRMNEEAINYGIPAIKERSLRAKNEGKFRDPKIVGRIIAKMSLSGRKYNPKTDQYDIPIKNDEIVCLSDENIEMEKMEQVYSKLLDLARPFYEKGRVYDLDQINWMIKQINLYADKLGLDKKILMPLAILHDIGYAFVPSNNPDIKSQEIKRIHLTEGVKAAKKILEEINYDPGLSKQILYFISVHDNWVFNDDEPYQKSKLLAFFNDLDFLFSMTDFQSFKYHGESMGRPVEEMYDFWRNDEKLVRRPFCCPETAALFEELMAARKREVDALK